MSLYSILDFKEKIWIKAILSSVLQQFSSILNQSLG